MQGDRDRRRLVLYRFAYIAMLVFCCTAIASATFPGNNGRIAFVQDGEIFTMEPDGSGLRQLTHFGPDSSASWPAWSADGKQIVFNVSPPPNGKPELWMMSADGSNQRLVLVEADYSENRPSFSPDGQVIVFGRCDLLAIDPHTCSITTVKPDGTSLTQLTPFQLDTNERSPMFSPDGRRISFISSTDAADGFLGVTFIMDSDGAHRRRLTPPDPCFIRPDWSPDGTRLVGFTHFCNPQPEDIAVIDPDGSGRVQSLTHNGTDYFSGFQDRNPAFSPDGRFIVFERNAPDLSSSAIYVMAANGGSMRPIAKLPLPKQSPRHYERGRKRNQEIEEGGSIPRWGVATE
jgi:Tol biopolymer transport system component